MAGDRSDIVERLLGAKKLKEFEGKTTTRVEEPAKFETRAQYILRMRRELYKKPEPLPPPEPFERTPYGPAYYKPNPWAEHEVDPQERWNR